MPVLVLERVIEGEIDEQTDEGTRQVGGEQPLAAVDEIGSVATANAAAEVTGLEEEEAHEVIGPLHNLLPPHLVTLSCERHDVQGDHAHDTDAAQDVECVVSRFLLFFHIQLCVETVQGRHPASYKRLLPPTRYTGSPRPPKSFGDKGTNIPPTIPIPKPFSCTFPLQSTFFHPPEQATGRNPEAYLPQSRNAAGRRAEIIGTKNAARCISHRTALHRPSHRAA